VTYPSIDFTNKSRSNLLIIERAAAHNAIRVQRAAFTVSLSPLPGLHALREARPAYRFTSPHIRRQNGSATTSIFTPGFAADQTRVMAGPD
jgi:hypothetical protein